MSQGTGEGVIADGSGATRDDRQAACLEWLERTRPAMDMRPVDALFMSTIFFVIALVTVPACLSTFSGCRHGSFESSVLVSTSDGYRLIDDERWTTGQGGPGERVGYFYCVNGRETRNCFGPCVVVQWPAPRAYLALERDLGLSKEECAALIESVPNVAERFEPTELLAIDMSDPTHIGFKFAPGPWSIRWSGVFGNVFFWSYFMFVGVCFLWFFRSLHRVCDPRRQRAERIVAGVCPTCRYDLRMTKAARCPECGDGLTVEVSRVG